MILNDRPLVQISRNLEQILSILNFLALKSGFFALCVAPLGARLSLGALQEENFTFLDFSSKVMYAHGLPKDFIKLWVA